MAAMLDTCIIIDFQRYQADLPDEMGIPAVVFAELAVGAFAVPPGDEREARRQRLEWAREFFDPYPFDADAAMAFGRIVTAVRRRGRLERSRIADLMIAATAAAHDQPLYTNNTDDFDGLDGLVEVIAL